MKVYPIPEQYHRPYLDADGVERQSTVTEWVVDQDGIHAWGATPQRALDMWWTIVHEREARGSS